MSGPGLPRWARLLLAPLREADAEVVRGDLEETHAPRPAHARGARNALLADVIRTLLAWWHPGAVRRRRELGIRMALGADPGGILRLVLGHGLTITAAGLGAGLAGAVALTRLLRSLLFGVGTLDLVSFAVAMAVLGASALLATVVPARHATAVDVVRSLRVD